MNERIKSLLAKAHLVTMEDLGDIDSNLVAEKFAELIVRECLNVINQPNGVGDDDVIRISDDVKKHFGVEE